MWTRSTGLGSAAASGHESAPIRRAWVSGDPAGIESAAGRRALSQTRAGGVISRERRAWGSGNPGTRQPAGGLGRATAGGGYLPRSAGMRARGQWTHGTCADPAELPRRLAVGYGGNNERRLPCRGTDTNRNQNKDFRKKTENKTGWMGAAYGWSGLLSRCTHEGGYRNTQTRT